METVAKDKLVLSANAKKVLERRYLSRDEAGKVVETPEEMFRRVARNIASADLLYNADADVKKTEEEFYEAMASIEFMPNSPTLMNAGRELQQLSACFVLPVEDSMESIFDAIKNTALIHRSGGGTGFSFSRLRPKNSVVKTTSGIASGPVSFMKVFDAATHAVKQGGTRRGANMGILRVDHPDIMEFITCKSSDNEITNFNISVALTENFMEKAERNENYDLIAPHTGKAVSQLNAREVFDKIVNMAWNNGEPGIIFLDRINRDNPTPSLGKIESTNPCGEQPLLPYESCNLGSINLSKMVKDGKIDYDRLRKGVHTVIHFLDNVIDMNRYPLAKIEEMTKRNRKIGLGIMGFADMLLKLGIPYDTERAVATAEEVMKFIQDESRIASCNLACSRGVFPNFENSIYNTDAGPRLRNATTTTIAPTGTISIIANCSSGIEPLFAVVYVRNVMDNDELLEVHPYFEHIALERGFHSDELMREIAKEGTIRKIERIPEDIRRLFVTAHDIDPIWHIKMQAAFQKYTDNAVSKTVNFPHDATAKEIEAVYKYAYEHGCKGVTIYRDRSRDEQVLNIGGVNKKEKGEAAILDKITPRPRPVVTTGTTAKMNTGCGSLYVTINVDDKGQPFEIFTQMGKTGGCAASQLEAVARLVSLALRSGIDVKKIVDQLEGIRCPSPSWERGGKIFSCADAIAKAVERRLGPPVAGAAAVKIEPKPDGAQKSNNVVGVCPDCDGALVFESGCVICKACGYSKCG